MRHALNMRPYFEILRAPDGAGSDPEPDDDLVLDDPVDDDQTPTDQVDATDDQTPPSDQQTQPPADQQTQDEPRGRAGETIRSLRSRAQEAERRADEAVRRAEDLDRRMRQFEQQSQQRPIDPQEEMRRLEQMTPDERAEYRVTQALTRFQNNQAIQNFQMADRMDSAQFRSTCETNPIARRYADAVEKELTKIRSEGGNVPREAVLFYVVGRALMDKQRTDGERRNNSAQNRIRRQTTRPGNSRGDVAASRNSRGGSLEERLADVPI